MFDIILVLIICLIWWYAIEYRYFLSIRKQSPVNTTRCKELLFLLRTYQNRGDSQTHSVSQHDLCPADGLCVQSLVLCERFKWEINIKRPFMAPSNKQLDSFCFASLLRFASTASAQQFPLQDLPVTFDSMALVN